MKVPFVSARLSLPVRGVQAKYELVSKGFQKYLDIKSMKFLNPLRDEGIDPILVLNPFTESQQTTGFLSVRKGNAPLLANPAAIINSFNQKMDAMGFLGLDKLKVPSSGIENKFENGRLVFQANQMTTVIDGFLQAGGGLGIAGNQLTFSVTAKVDIKGLASGDFNLGMDEKGQLNGRANIEANIANINASLLVEYLAGTVTIQGTGKIQSEKFEGSITLLVTDKARSKQMMNAALGLETMEQQNTDPKKAKPKTPRNQVLAGWGEVTATITPWLQGNAKIGIDAAGHVTIVGEIAVPSEVQIMEQRGKKVELFNVEISAGYGIPLVGQAFLFASVGMFVNAGFGPLVLKNVGFTGTYSTDPSILQKFQITGTLGINAFAIVGLQAEAGVGITIIGHDVKAGVNVSAGAGLQAYAEATPTLQYQEKKAPEGGKVGESRIKGHFEAAAQLFLQLSGSLFYELDSPWWSPAPDTREDFPLGQVQYPIGESMGIGADLDWLIGSPDIPEVKFSPVQFDPDKFTADIMGDPPPRKLGDSKAKPAGKWEDGKSQGSQKDKPELKKGGKGLGKSKKKEENLKNLPDEKKYMRALDEISKIKDGRSKPTERIVGDKIFKIKNKYGIHQVQLRAKKDDSVKVYVRHAKQNNSKHMVEIPIMSEVERAKLMKTAMTDLNTRLDKKAGEKGTLTQTDAKTIGTKWKKAHKVVESVSVVDGKSTWDFSVDIGDKKKVVKGKGKGDSGRNLVQEEVKEELRSTLNGKFKSVNETKKLLSSILKKYKHKGLKELTVEQSGKKQIRYLCESKSKTETG